MKGQPVAAVDRGRNRFVDAVRGAAVAMMIAYHFCFDLTWFGWAGWRMLDEPGWIAWRNAIVTGFLFVVGISLALRDARERGTPKADWFARDFVRRWLQIAGAAILVTAGSAMLFPDRYIYFGVLHFVAVAVWLCRRAPRLGLWAVAAGVAVIAIGLSIEHPAFDPRVANWLGFATVKPATEDYVPLLPWLGVVLIGCGVGGSWPGRSVSGPRVLAWMGRWSLTIYLVHQPLLMGILAGVTALVRK